MKTFKKIMVNLLGYPVTIPIWLLDLLARVLMAIAIVLNEGIRVPYADFVLKVFKMEEVDNDDV